MAGSRQPMSPSAPLSPPSEFAPPFSTTTRVTSLADVRRLGSASLFAGVAGAGAVLVVFQSLEG